MIVTRLGLYGGSRGLYGDFTTKEEGVPVVDEFFFGAGDDQLMEEDELFLAIIKDFAGKMM